MSDATETAGLKGQLFRWGWLLFFAGIPFLTWSAVGLLLILIHWAVDRPKPSGGELTRFLADVPRVYRMAVLGSLAVYALSIIPAVNRSDAFAEGLGFGLLLLFGMTYAFRLEALRPGWWQTYVWVSPVTGAASALVGLYQNVYISRYPLFAGRMTGSHENPNAYSTALMFGLYLGLVALSRYRDWRRWLMVPYAALMIAALLTTGSRGAWVGVLAGIALFMLLLVARHWRLRPGRAVLLGVGGVLAGVLIVWFVYQAVGPSTQARMASVIDIGANQDRVTLYDTMVRMIKDNLWFGVGMGNIKHRFAEFQTNPKRQPFGTAHNFVLQALGETGVFGGAFLLLLLGSWFVLGWPGDGAPAAVLFLYSLLGALLVRDLFDNALTNFYVFFVANWVGGTLVGARSAARNNT